MKRKINLRNFSGFLIGFSGGVLFAIGLLFISPPTNEPLTAIVLHILAPAAFLGFLSLLVQEYVRARVRAGISSYLFSGFLGAAALVALACFTGFVESGRNKAGMLYLIAWAGFICGMAVRLAVDEIIVQFEKGKKMKLMREKDIPKQIVDAEGAKDSYIQWLIDEKDGAHNFALRRITVKPGGSTPLHKHDYEHEVFVLNGKGVLLFEGKEYLLEPNEFAFVNPNVEHQFKNSDEEDLVFLCIIPTQKK